MGVTLGLAEVERIYLDARMILDGGRIGRARTRWWRLGAYLDARFIGVGTVGVTLGLAEVERIYFDA
ncbi:hypothetical protein CKO27_20825 [Thiocystis violacea]|nr:hypothetical protein [Thiocystis violacea]